MLKNHPKLRIFCIDVIQIIAFIIGLIVFPLICYPLRYKIEDNPQLYKKLGLWYFCDNSEPNFIDNWYGVYEIFDNDYVKFHTLNWFQKWVLSVKWAAFRNPHWNLKLILGIGTIGDIENLVVLKNTGGASATTWRNYKHHGEQHVTFNKGEYKHFRKSKTVPMWKYHPFRLFGGRTHYNKMKGCGANRYITKRRWFKFDAAKAVTLRPRPSAKSHNNTAM